MAAGSAFPSRREAVLQWPCWLDAGSERARRGFLFEQLCCVGGCSGQRGLELCSVGAELGVGPGWLQPPR